jgi:hypothetical protein
MAITKMSIGVQPVNLFTVPVRPLSQGGRTPAMIAGLMEKIMSKTNDTPNLGHGTLADSELDMVSGGKLIDAATPKLHEAACKGTHLPEVVIEVW